MISNTNSVAQEMSELWSILQFGGHIVFWLPFYFSIYFHNLFRKSIQTSMQNLDSVAQEMSELCSILWFGSHFVFWRPFRFSKFCQNLFRLSIRTSMENLESVAQKMAQWWVKWRSTFSSSDYTVQTSFFSFGQYSKCPLSYLVQ